MLCKNCGTEINQNESVCKNCGYNNFELPYMDNDAVLDTTSSEYSPNIESQPPQKPKKSKAVIIVTTVIIAIIIIAIAIRAIFFISTLNNTSQPIENTPKEPTSLPTEATTPPEINIDDYYISGGSVTYIADPDNPVAVTYTNENDPDGDPQTLILNEDKYAFDGQAFYSQQGFDTEQLYKFTFVDKTTLVKSIWVTNDTISNSPMGKESSSSSTEAMQNWTYDNGYIYFNYMSIIEASEKLHYRLGRISVKGNSIEIFNHIATDFTINDGWIYFYDSGLVEIENATNEYHEDSITHYVDYTKAGIYKLKPGNKNIQILKAGYIPDLDEDYDSTYTYSNLNIFGEYLYFIDNSSDGNGRVCRMKLDGSDFDYLTTNSATEFTVDEEANTLYYSDDIIREPQKIIQVSLKDKTEKEIISVDVIRNSKLKFKNNSLYFAQNYIFESASKNLATCGARYNFNTNKLEYLQRYYEFEEVKEDIFAKQIVKGPYFYWEELTDKNGYFKQ